LAAPVVSRDKIIDFCMLRIMKNIRNILIFSVVLLISTASHAYFGVKIGGFNSGGDTSWGGGVVFGLPILVPGLAVEIEQSGYYNSGTPDIFFTQTSAGPVFDFNPILTPDSNFFHPYIRGGLAYAFLFSSNDTLLADQNGPGFFTGAGLNFNFPIISIGVEANYNYINFDTADNDYWTYFVSGGIHF
jgi:hypothetical protein